MIERPGLAVVIAVVALVVVVGCGPRTYGECMRGAETDRMSTARMALEVGAVDSFHVLYPAEAAAWARCCELPDVYPGDQYGCERSRRSVEMHAPGGILAENR